MAFTVQLMLGSKALVTGTDTLGASGSTIVDTTQWDELNARLNFSAAVEDYNAAVERFFAPLTEAADLVATTVKKDQDPMEYVVLKEGREAVEGAPDEIVELTHDSMILRFIDSGDTDRLVWINESELGILAKV